MRLADLDRDDAIAEALDALHGTTRAGFFRGALLGSAGLLAASAAPPTGTPRLRLRGRP